MRLEGLDTPAGPRKGSVPRLAYGPDEAAQALGCSRDFFDREILPHVKAVRRGRRIFISIKELEKWLDNNGARLIG